MGIWSLSLASIVSHRPRDGKRGDMEDELMM